MVYLTVDIGHRPKESEANVYPDGTRWYSYFGNVHEPITVIEYSKLDWLPGYIRVVHHANGNSRIKNIKWHNKPITLTKEHEITTVSIYYWSGDLTHSKPLILQINENSCYEPGNWTPLSKMDNYAAILAKLDEQNCRLNSAHLVDIGQVRGGYKCLCCRKQEITLCYDVFKLSCSEFGMYTHNVSNGCIGRIVEGSMAMIGLGASKNANSVYVFCYKGSHLAICMQLVSFTTFEFFQRDAINSKGWTKITFNTPVHPFDTYKILDVLKRASGESDEAHERLKRLGIAAGVGAGLAFVIMTIYHLIPTQKNVIIMETIKKMMKPKEIKYITMH